MEALDRRFYSRYVDQIRLMANKQLSSGASRDLLKSAEIEDVPDMSRDLLMRDAGVNVYLSNSISLQFAPGKTNSVTAQVQGRLPVDRQLSARLKQGAEAAGALEKMAEVYDVPKEQIMEALLGGTETGPVYSGMKLSANPSIGFDGGSMTLSLSAEQTMEAGAEQLADRVTSHKIEDATITAASYEPMVLSTLSSNVSYYTSAGGVPGLRRIPILKDILNEMGGPLRQTRKAQGVYQSSLLILEPVVIPTIEDLIRFHDGWRDSPDVRGPSVAAGEMAGGGAETEARGG